MSTDAGKGALTTTPAPGAGSKPDAPTLTKAQAEKMVSDALSGAGRDAQTLGAGRTQLEADRAAHDSAVKAFQTRMDEAEDAAHRDNPGALTLLQSQRNVARAAEDLKRREADVSRRDAALKERESSVSKQTHAALAAKISSEFGVAIEPLLTNTDGTEAQMRSLAPMLTKTGKPAPGDTTSPDSGRGAGGAELTADNIDKLYMEGKVSDAVYRNFLRTGQVTVGA